MDAAGILSQIRPCDQDNPLHLLSVTVPTTICWSGKMHRCSSVLAITCGWTSAILDKTKASWTDDAGSDQRPGLYVAALYVSSSSLTSEPLLP